jgi:RNA polymerase primary sigma factor
MLKKEGPEIPLLDRSDAAVKELIRRAKTRGYVTRDQINALLSSEEVKSEQIEDILAKLSETGVSLVESKEAELEEEVATREQPEEEGEVENELVEVQQWSVSAKSETKEPAERTNDPVRMYFHDMSSVELLSRESETAIAKRIEAGREAMIAGLCESPLTFQAIIIWRDELNDGKVLLRNIIDLEATYSGPDAKAIPASVIGPDGQLIERIAAPSQPRQPLHMQAPATAPTTAHDDDDDMENWLSAGAIEAELKPKIIETFDCIAGTYKRLRRLQDQDIQFQLIRRSLSPAQERKYKKLKNEIIAEVKSLRLNRARIEALIDQLYDINKRLVGFEGSLLRLAESHGVAREDFLTNYLGSALDPLWLNRVSNLLTKGWKNFVAHDKDIIKELRTQIHELASQIGLEIGELRKIVRMVQKGDREALQAKQGDGGGEPASCHLDRKEIHQSRPAVP